MQLLLSLVSLALVLLPAFALARASTEPRAEEILAELLRWAPAFAPCVRGWQRPATKVDFGPVG
jgi:hypothetical protein